MTFHTFGRTLLLLAGSAGLTLGLTSCTNNHTVGYVYVLGTTNNGQPGGQISELREDNNNGALTPVSGSPISSGGLNPVRAVAVQSRFVYVLNQGTAKTNANGAIIDAYNGSDIQLFSIGGYGQLTPQLQFSSQGYGSERLIVDSTGSHLWVLDQYANVGAYSSQAKGDPPIVNGVAPVASANQTSDYPCVDPKDSSVYHPVGSITLFNIDGSTGRLSTGINTQQSSPTPTLFQVGCNPVDFHLAGQYLYTMDAGSVASATHTDDVQTVNVYAVATTGQLTPTQTAQLRVTSNNSSAITAITGDGAGKYVYLVDTAHNLLYEYTVGSGGALVPVTGSPFDNSQNSQAGGPVQTLTDSTNRYLYVINGGPPTGNQNAAAADLGTYTIESSNGLLQPDVQGAPIPGIVSGPVCIFEDPTNQYIYVAGSLDNSITGRKIDPNTGLLRPLNKAGTFPTVGTPSWCLGISSAF